MLVALRRDVVRGTRVVHVQLRKLGRAALAGLQRPDQVVQLALDDDGRLPAAPVGKVGLFDELPRERERVIKLTAMLTG